MHVMALVIMIIMAAQSAHHVMALVDVELNQLNQLEFKKMDQLTFALPNDNVLKTKAQEITTITPEIFDLAKAMVITMASRGGIGLAAPQVCFAIQLIVVYVPHEMDEPLVLLNPKITNKTQSTDQMDEGCLSFPYLGVNVERATGVTVKFMALNGDVKSMKFAGLTARAIQHEVDHLNGITLRDYMVAWS